MTDRERIYLLVDRVVELHRNNLKTLARLKAIEAVVADSFPPPERAAWYAKVDSQYERCFQDLLEGVENQSQSFAALLDDRKLGDLSGLD